MRPGVDTGCYTNPSRRLQLAIKEGRPGRSKQQLVVQVHGWSGNIVGEYHNTREQKNCHDTHEFSLHLSLQVCLLNRAPPQCARRCVCINPFKLSHVNEGVNEGTKAKARLQGSGPKPIDQISQFMLFPQLSNNQGRAPGCLPRRKEFISHREYVNERRQGC
jgi:hypothetical protein